MPNDINLIKASVVVLIMLSSNPQNTSFDGFTVIFLTITEGIR